MPKTTIDKDRSLTAGEDDIRATRQGALNAVAKPTVPKRLPQSNFRLSIFGPYLRHAEGSLAACQNVYHRPPGARKNQDRNTL